MRVRKTLIFPLDEQSLDTHSRHLLLYRAANWLDGAMRSIQTTRGSEATSDATRFLQIPMPAVRFRRSLMKSRHFMTTRGRLPGCTHLRRPGPHHW